MPPRDDRPSTWFDALGRVQRSQHPPIYMPAALWAAFDMLDDGVGASGRFLFSEFEPRFVSVLQQARLPGKDKAWQPFFYLSRGPGIWELILRGEPTKLHDTPERRPKSRGELLKMADAAQLGPDLLEEISSPVDRQRVRDLLIADLLRATHADAVALGKAIQSKSLILCQRADDIAGSLKRFNRDSATFSSRARELIRSTQYWIWDPSGDRFGPSKFVGYKGMSFPLYERAHAGNTNGARFDGHITQTAIRRVLATDFAPNEWLTHRLVKWAGELLGPESLHRVKENKWRFLHLPPGRRYWGLFLNSEHYDIEAAVRELGVDSLTISMGNPVAGDRVVLLRSPAVDGKSGIVALAEILSPPDIRLPHPESTKYWKIPQSAVMTRQVLLRYFVSPRLPLGTAADTDAHLLSLLPAHGQDGKAYPIAPEPWWRIIDALGGWPSLPTDQEEAVSIITESRIPEAADKKASISAPRLEDVARQDVLSDLGVGEVVGDYRLVGELGEGGMGKVFLAEHTQIHQKVAIKFLLQRFRYTGLFFARLKKEADILANLGHPGIVKVHTYGWYPPDEPTIPYIVMEYIMGESLASLISSEALTIRPAQVVSYAQQICSALAAIHRAGIVHRDLKPSNIMLVPADASGRVSYLVLIDFGVAKDLRAKDDSALTRTGEHVGTERYMSPEQFHDASAVGAETDIYSFGKTLSEMTSRASAGIPAVTRKLFALAQRMSELSPKDRPTLDAIQQELQQLTIEISAA